MNILPFQSQAETASGIAGMALGAEFGAAIPGLGTLESLGKAAANPGGSAASAILSVLGPHPGARIVTGLVGLLLIAAAIMTHPTVVALNKKLSKDVGEKAVIAAAAA